MEQTPNTPARVFKIRASQCWKIMSNAKKEGELSQTCKTYLQEWYANDQEEIKSKYTDKGKVVEKDAIDFAIQAIGAGIGSKNTEHKEDDHMTGEADLVLSDTIIDVKAPWNNTTFLQNTSGMDEDYKWQGRVYMHLWNKDKFILFYALMDTPEDVNYGNEVIYSDRSDNERWIAYQINHDQLYIQQIRNRVIKCREYLAEYDTQVKSKLGKLNIIS